MTWIGGARLPANAVEPSDEQVRRSANSGASKQLPLSRWSIVSAGVSRDAKPPGAAHEEVGACRVSWICTTASGA